MDAFTIEIAGLAVHVQPLFESTREYCKAYLTNRDPEFTVCITGDDLFFEQMMLEKEAVEEGLKIRKFQGPFLERSIIQRWVADRLLHRNTVLLHGSTVSVEGRAYLFTAPCRTGKSTHTRLWRELFGDRAVMVNDDKAFLQINSSGVFACGSPWCGKHGLGANICVPLKGICLLHRGSENTIRWIDAESAMEVLRRQTHSPTDVSLLPMTFSLLDILADRVPLWEMHCNKDAEAALVSYSAMSGAERTPRG